MVATARRLDRLEALAAEIEATGGVCLPVQMDVTDAPSMVAAVDKAVEVLGLPTILINNAGMPDAQRATKMSVDFIDTVIDTNLRGPYILACEIARRLIEAKRPGRIVNISSVAGFHYSGEGAALYSITKAGVNRMTEALAVEWSKFHINVNGIAPGAFASEFVTGTVIKVDDGQGPR